MSGAVFALFAACAAGGVLPWINAEVIVVAAAAVRPGGAAVVAVVGAGGHLTGKAAVYALARWFPDRLPARVRAAMDRAPGLASSGWTASLLVLGSAGIGVPPFYLVTLAAGVLGMPAPLYLGAGFAGLTLRYWFLAKGAAALGGLLP